MNRHSMARDPSETVAADRRDGSSSPGRPSSFWRRRVVDPLMGQLKQGITPEKLALSLALGLVLGCFPILGAATLLCTVAGLALGLNQPVIQAVNQVVYPLQLALLLPHYRAGEWLFQTPSVPLSIPMLYDRFAADWRQFLQDYGLLALQGVAVWCLVAPLVAAGVYFLCCGPLRVLARGVAR
jgi:uncharacterized protein (DUF2062 family)